MQRRRNRKTGLSGSEIMNEMYVDDIFRLPCPDGFHIMDEEETSRLNILEGGSFIGLSDPGRHMIVTIGWKKTNGLLSLILKTKDIAERMEKTIGRAMKNSGFQREGHLERIIAGSKAEGFSYYYTAQDTDMLGQSFVVKDDKTVVYFHFYARTALRKESLKVWNMLLDSVKRA